MTTLTLNFYRYLELAESEAVVLKNLIEPDKDSLSLLFEFQELSLSGSQEEVFVRDLLFDLELFLRYFS